MKLIIDIPEYLYENIKRSMNNDTESLYVGEQAIANGTPLAEFCDSCIYKKDEDD